MHWAWNRGHAFSGGDKCHLNETGLRALVEALLPTLEAFLSDDVCHKMLAMCLYAVPRS